VMKRYRAHLTIEVGEGDTPRRIRVLLPWLMRRRGRGWEVEAGGGEGRQATTAEAPV